MYSLEGLLLHLYYCIEQTLALPSRLAKNVSCNYPCRKSTAGFTSKHNSKIRGALKDLELLADLVHETTSGA